VAYYSEVSFTDTEQYSMGYWRFPEFKMCNLFYYMYDRFGLGLLDAELTLFTQVEMLRQTEYTC
jgi:hypothetical protein